MRLLHLSIFALISLQSPLSVPTPAPTWIWFHSVSTGTDWWITKGKGNVDLSGRLFKATLRDGEDPQLLLNGSIASGVVTARLTILESDAPVAELSGRLKRLCWRGGGREILILANGADVVGLFRELDRSMPCKPVG